MKIYAIIYIFADEELEEIIYAESEEDALKELYDTCDVDKLLEVETIKANI